ncbi:MAG: DUF4339 domain-containing protein [Parachlamydiaceae bacterium]|nr:MAG: DUF4339 domain-containing protein [Parachlamydiaceae bacterium]
MRMLISLLLLLFFAFLSAYIAKQRGRDPVAWFMIGILLGVFSPLLLLILKPLTEQEGERETEENEDLKLAPQKEFLEIGYAQKEWFYLDKSRQQQGPVYFSALKLLWVEEKITPATYVWSEGMDQWKRIQELPGFVEAL